MQAADAQVLRLQVTAERLGRKQGACSGKLQTEDLLSSPSFYERVPTSEAGPGDIFHCSSLPWFPLQGHLTAAAHGEKPQTFYVHPLL